MAAGAHMVKIEGGRPMLETMRFLTERGIPVCGHLGLTPQSVHQLGGYKVQGKGETAAQRLLREAKHARAGGRRHDRARGDSRRARAPRSPRRCTIPTIGIGAGADCSGQVLVLYDMLDVYPGRKAKFVKNYMRPRGHGAGRGRALREGSEGRDVPRPRAFLLRVTCDMRRLSLVTCHSH